MKWQENVYKSFGGTWFYASLSLRYDIDKPKVDSLFLKSFCHRFTLMFRVTVLLRHLTSTELQLMDSYPDITL